MFSSDGAAWHARAVLRGPSGRREILPTWMRRIQVTVATASVAAALASLAACGHGSDISDGVAVRVGAISITVGTVERWMVAMAPEHVFPDPPRFAACIAHEETLVPQAVAVGLEEECAHQYQALRRRALGFLISSAWLVGEGAETGMRPFDREVEGRLRTATKASLNGRSVADVKLAVEAELVEAKLGRRLAADIPQITAADVAAYYARHIQRFERPERRYIAIVERLPTPAAARKFMREVTEGRSLSSAVPYHEVFGLPNIADVVPKKRAVMRHIFAAPAHVLVGPERLNGYSVFEVTRIVPRAVQPLSRVKHEVEARLVSEEQRRALVRFVAAWRRRWIARTDCRPGYIVQKCSAYRGVRLPEDPSAFS